MVYTEFDKFLAELKVTVARYRDKCFILPDDQPRSALIGVIVYVPSDREDSEGDLYLPICATLKSMLLSKNKNDIVDFYNMLQESQKLLIETCINKK